MDKLIAALASELIEPEENWNVLWIQNRRQYNERSGHLPPKAQWAFVALLCLLLLLAPHPAAAQFPGSWPTRAPTAKDVDPGVDHTANAGELPPALRRTSIFYRTQYPVGTIIVNTADRFLYLITGQNTALRYGIGVGRDGFQWGGILRITRNAQWPDRTTAARDDRAPALSATLHGRRFGQSARRSRTLHWHYSLPHPWYQCA
jgi:hypothetical protein